MPTPKEKDLVDQAALSQTKGGDLSSPELEHRELSQIEEILFQDLDQSEDFALKGEAGEITLEEIPWTALSVEEEKEITSEEPAAAVIVDPQAIQEMSQLNRKVFQNCHGFLELVPRLHTLTRQEWEAYKVKMVLDRDVIEERMQKVQGWVNASILRGELEQMKFFNELKASLYETLNLLRKIIADHFTKQPQTLKTDDSAKPTQEEAEKLFLDVTDQTDSQKNYKHKRFARPVAKKKKEKLGYAFTAKVIDRDRREIVFKKTIFFSVLALAQVVFLISYFSIQMSFEKVDPRIYSSSLPLTKAQRFGSVFMGEVKEGWVTLSAAEKKRQVESLALMMQAEGVESISLAYPNRNPAASFILGQTTVF